MGYYLPSGLAPSACRTPTREKGFFVAHREWDTNRRSGSSHQTLSNPQAMATCDRGPLTFLLGSLLLCAVLVLLVGHRRQEPAVPEVTQLENPKSFSSYITTLRRVRREVEPPAVTTPQPPLEDIGVQDVFIAVKTTSKFHRSRLDLLMDTWVSRSKEQTFIFTDDDDEELKKRTANVINTNCSSAHSRQALSCKMAVEYDKFIESGKKWFCHVDDDNYVNIRTLVKLLSAHPHTQDIYIGKPSLDRPIQATERISESKMRPVSFWFATGGAGFCISRGLALKMSPWASGGHFMSTSEKIRLPDDCTIGYIIEAVLGVKLIRSNLFHSHLENLYQVPSSEIHKQVTLSYGMFENKRNAINMRGAFSIREDPSRFRSIHCLLYPDTPWCPQNIVY